jgi:hypothetical protein
MNPGIEAFIGKVKEGRPVDFQDTLQVITDHYDYRPTRFFNGLAEDRLVNEPGSNEGSCRIFYFAKLHGLSEPETLALFGAYYRDEVLANPDGDNHRNIRTFMKYGWEGIRFDGAALEARSAGI